MVRLTKEQLLAVRKPTKILESMNNLQIPNIMSLLPLTPINVENSDADEVFLYGAWRCVLLDVFYGCFHNFLL